jgi:ketosteroid isomerase-like protein
METTTEHPNVKLVRDGMEAFNRGEIDTYVKSLSDDIVWHQIGAPTLHGKQEMAENMPGGDVEWNITTDVHDILANDEHAIAMVEAHATRGDGKTLDYRTTEIVHIRDGKVTERWAFSDDTQKIIDFFAG